MGMSKGLKTLVLGLGNPILSDDSVGIRVAQAIRQHCDKGGVTVLESSLAGLDLLDLIIGYDKLILIDAIQTVDGHAGEVYHLEASDLSATLHTTSPHTTNFATALELGKRLGLALPREIAIFAIEAKDVVTFGEECTPEVEKSIAIAADMVAQELDLTPDS